jgi:hypothetical protein
MIFVCVLRVYVLFINFYFLKDLGFFLLRV